MDSLWWEGSRGLNVMNNKIFLVLKTSGIRILHQLSFIIVFEVHYGIFLERTLKAVLSCKLFKIVFS